MGHAPVQIVKSVNTPLGQTVDVDVAICGGTLGIFVATALAVRGIKTAVVERGVVAGRAQEWNISRKELQEIIEIGVLTAEEVEEVCVHVHGCVRMYHPYSCWHVVLCGAC